MGLARKLSMLTTALRLGGSNRHRLELVKLCARHGGLLPFTHRMIDIGTRIDGAPQLHLRDTASDAVLFVEVLVEEDYSALRSLPFKPRHILDIGANIGLASFYMRALFAEATLEGCEPASSEGAVLERNYASWPQSKRLPVAIGDQDHVQVAFAVHPGKTGGQHLLEPGEDGDWQQVMVPMRRVDSLIEEGAIHAPDLVKIDIEGAEVEALKGFGRHLATPRAYILETHSAELHAECKALLEGAGFQVLDDRARGAGARIVCMVRNN